MHPLVQQLRFVRSEWLRALDGVTDDESLRRFLPMNSIGWIVGHLAWQEQRYFLTYSPLQQTPVPELNEIVRNGGPATTPPLSEMLDAWHTITVAADAYLDEITTEDLQAVVPYGRWETSTGSRTLRVIYHYWYHIGEIMSIRQLLGHTNLPEFVGDIDAEAPYAPH